MGIGLERIIVSAEFPKYYEHAHEYFLFFGVPALGWRADITPKTLSLIRFLQAGA